MATQFRQDMPPEGGYAPVRWGRVAQKRSLNGWIAVGLYIGVSTYGYLRHAAWKQYLQRCDIEKFDAYVAMEPFITAERDRSFLKNLWCLREEERSLMKEHPGWVVGTLYGEPLYTSIDKNDMPDLQVTSFYAHRPYMSAMEYRWPDMWT